MGIPAPKNGGTNSGKRSLDIFLTVLADQHRRGILQYFHESTNDTATLRELVEYLCEDESDHEQTKVQLIHKHIPKGAKCGILAYNEQHDQVRYFTDERLEELFGCVQAIEWE